MNEMLHCRLKQTGAEIQTNNPKFAPSKKDGR